VKVDDARFTLTSDQLFVFLESTNTLERLVVKGNVKVINEDRRASCDRAVYIRAEERLVMAGNAKLQSMDKNGKARTVKGDKITIWTKKGDQRMEVYPNPELVIPAGSTEGLKDVM
jgi:lipopolysaccharide export system protein LptA